MTAFGYFRPDTADTSNAAILRAAVNVFYKPGGLGPVPSFVALPGAVALTEAPRGGISGVTGAGVYLAFVGTETTIQRLANDGSWVDVSPTPAPSLPAGDNWSFAKFGKYIIATNKADGMYYYDLDAGGVFTAIAGAPVARVVWYAFNALFAGDCDGNNRVVKSSKLGDPLVWTGAGTTYQEMQVGEEILGGGEISSQSALMVQRSGVTPLTRRADAKVYDMGTTWTGIGATNPEAMLFVRGYVIFVDTKGFYAAASDGLPVQIGDGKVDRYFLANVSGNGLDRVQSAYWASENVAVFRYKSGSSTGGDEITDDALMIDLGEQAKFEFSQLSGRTALIVAMATPGYTTDGMDSFGTVDDMVQIPLDSRFWFGGEARFGALSEDYKFGFHDGTPAEAVIETSTEARRASEHIGAVQFMSDATNYEIEIGTSDRLRDTLTWNGPFVEHARSGIVPTRAEGKNSRYRATIAAGDDWSFANGIEIVSDQTEGARAA